MAKTREEPANRLDMAARAGWLYYVAGNTQDEIAAKLGLSRQAAQRLVSLSMSSGLVRVRIEHPVAETLELGRSLADRFGLNGVEVALADPSKPSLAGIASACAARLERELQRTEPLVIGVGTGRSLRSAVEQMSPMRCPQHRIVSLTGSIAPDGTAAVYNVIFSLADKIEAAHYPMPLPVVAPSPHERTVLREQAMLRSLHELARCPDLAFVGVGEMGPRAPLLADRFISAEECAEVIELGAVGEIIGWIFDRNGRVIDCALTRRVLSAPLPFPDTTRVVAVAAGASKVDAILGALRGHLVDELITDEETARLLLEAGSDADGTDAPKGLAKKSAPGKK
jgi:DNA-binding transcriptional regulator LsrR (DeoR family)